MPELEEMALPTSLTSVGSLSPLEVEEILRSRVLLDVCIALLVFICLYITLRKPKVKGLSFPPGPRALPLVGNLLSLNTAEPWLSYTEWGKKYGDLLYVRLLGQNFIILNSENIARKLLDQRSSIYSDRPVIPTNTLFGVDFSTVMLRYGDEWRLHRKLFHQALRPESDLRYREVYFTGAQRLLVNILEAPAYFDTHLKDFVASNVMALAYGYEVEMRDDPIVRTVRELVDLLTKALSPERTAALAAFPFLQHLPDWFPGAGFKRQAAYSRQLAAQVLNEPFNLTKKDIASGNAPPSIVADCLSQIDETVDYDTQEFAIKAVAATAFIGKPSSLLHSFILAMLLYPEVQTKAQAEIDRVIGTEKLPSFDDRLSLPYIDAVLHELLRWSPVTPLGIPHATTTDDVCNGYYIPKGALVIINVWAMSRNKMKFDDTEDFKPERFMTEDGKLVNDPATTSDPIFGLGRRICPGRFAAEAFLWMAIVSILSMFRITKAKDAYSKEIPVERKFTTGISVHPVDFPCWFISRSAGRERLIRQL
ncbi:cytochrome P450 [Pisolithus tinctorius]|nr:cytochrome P450 [Pisolithus tinctorius]